MPGKDSRSPCGERGLKLPLVAVVALRLLGRSPCGERGLKLLVIIWVRAWGGRSPCGERGLKYHRVGARFQCLLVAPRAGSVD